MIISHKRKKCRDQNDKPMQVKYYYQAAIITSISCFFFSWAVFWIGADKLPERISICIALILAQLILIVGAAEDFPNTSDFKLVDLYLIVNFFINSAALLETIVASIASRAPIKFKSRCKKDKNGNSDVSIMRHEKAIDVVNIAMSSKIRVDS